MVTSCRFLAMVLFVVSSLALNAVAHDADYTARSLVMDSKIGILPQDVSRSSVAVRLAQVVDKAYKGDIHTFATKYGFEPSDGIYLESGIDAVYLARVESRYCAAAFRGTAYYQIRDWLTNIDLEPVAFGTAIRERQQEQESYAENDAIDTASLEQCDVHSGYNEAYTNFEYRDQVEDFLKNCQSECVECETILTGHSQGGGIAAIAALYMKYNLSTDRSNNYDGPYVITFGGPQSLGAGCDPLISENERKRWFRYVMAREQFGTGDKLVYDPIPHLFARLLDPPEEEDQHPSDDSFLDNVAGLFDMNIDINGTYARNGGLAFVGQEILLSTGDPSSVLLSALNSHRFVDLDFLDLTGIAHHDYIYGEVLEAQDKIYNSGCSTDNCHGEGDDVQRAKILDATERNGSLDCPETFLPSTGFALGSLCNPDEIESSSTCVDGTVCAKEEKWWVWGGSKHACQTAPSLDEIPQFQQPMPISTVAPSEEATTDQGIDDSLETIMVEDKPVPILGATSSGAYQARTLIQLQKSLIIGMIATLVLAPVIDF